MYFESDICKKRANLFCYMSIWNFSTGKKRAYLEAFDFFEKNPKMFNGSTFSIDKMNIPGLDICSMIHDYMYVCFNIDKDFILKKRADLIYCNELRRFNNSWINTWAVRFFGLFISSPYFLIRGFFNQKKINRYGFCKFVKNINEQ